MWALWIGCADHGAEPTDAPPDYRQQVVGTWVNTHLNNQPLPTDSAFVMDLRASGVEMYAVGLQLDADNRAWRENDNYTYSVQGDVLAIDGKDTFGKTYHIKFRVDLSADTVMTMAVQAFAVDGTSYPNANTYTMHRVQATDADSLVGVWYGRCTSGNNSDAMPHYWAYAADGSYSYYYQDSAGVWLRKADNSGRYFLYGSLLATNWSNDLLTGGQGLAYECWRVEIAGRTMKWSGLRPGGKVVTYEMSRVDSPPAVGKR
jgi:hypothetical protein